MQHKLSTYRLEIRSLLLGGSGQARAQWQLEPYLLLKWRSLRSRWSMFFTPSLWFTAPEHRINTSCQHLWPHQFWTHDVPCLIYKSHGIDMSAYFMQMGAMRLNCQRLWCTPSWNRAHSYGQVCWAQVFKHNLIRFVYVSKPFVLYFKHSFFQWTLTEHAMNCSHQQGTVRVASLVKYNHAKDVDKQVH